MRFLRYLFVSALFWLVFLAGYLCRDALGDWLMAVHTGSVWTQIVVVSTGLFRVFLTFVLLAVVVVVCVYITFFVSAVIQEGWYQFFQRRIVQIFARQRQRREEELQQAAEDEDSDDIGAPKESVNARKHARRAREGVHNPPPDGAPKKSLMGRLRELDQQAQSDMAAEVDVDDSEITVTIIGEA